MKKANEKTIKSANEKTVEKTIGEVNDGPETGKKIL